jgi:glucose/arabinose dehydrogenase
MRKLYAVLVLFTLAFLPGKLAAQYDIVSIATGLEQPVSMAQSSDGRFFITLRGNDGFGPSTDAQLVVYDENGTFLSLFWDFSDSVETYFERGLLGIALDPDFDNNHYVYAFYNHLAPASLRVVRFTEAANVGTNPTVIMNITDPFSAGNHTGGNIHIRPSEPDKLYITIGDRATSANSQTQGNPFGKILRINTDGTIPADNPFYDDGDPDTGNDDRIYAWGLRNTFDFAFSTVNDSLYASENGWNDQDEVNQITAGWNYGWPECEGEMNLNGNCNDPAFTAPMDVWDNIGNDLPAVTGIIVYDGAMFPQFQNHMMVADYTFGEITDFELTNAPAYDQVGTRSTAFTLSGITDLLQGNDDCIYVIEGGYTTAGKLTRICPDNIGIDENEAAQSFNLMPNPATAYTQLNFSEGFVGQHFEVVDMLGKVVLTQRIENSRETLNLTDLKAGMYFVKAHYKGGFLSERLIIE